MNEPEWPVVTAGLVVSSGIRLAQISVGFSTPPGLAGVPASVGRLGHVELVHRQAVAAGAHRVADLRAADVHQHVVVVAGDARAAVRRAAQILGVGRVGELDPDDVDAVAGAAGAADVEVQVAARVIRHAGRRVRAAAHRRGAGVVAGRRHPQLALVDGGRGVRDVPDVDALEAQAGRVAHARRVLVRRGVARRIPRADEDVAVHDDVTLARGVPARLGVVDLGRVRRIGDVDDPEAAPVALEGEVALEGDVGVDVGEAVARARRRDPRRVADRRHVRALGVRLGRLDRVVGARRRSAPAGRQRRLDDRAVGVVDAAASAARRPRTSRNRSPTGTWTWSATSSQRTDAPVPLMERARTPLPHSQRSPSRRGPS